MYLFIHIPKHNGQFRTFCINPKYLQLILSFCNTGASQPAILSNIKPFRGCPHITAAAGGEGFVNADVSRGEGKSIIILPDVIVCGQLQNRDLLRTYVCFNWNFALNETFSRICCHLHCFQLKVLLGGRAVKSFKLGEQVIK